MFHFTDQCSIVPGTNARGVQPELSRAKTALPITKRLQRSGSLDFRAPPSASCRSWSTISRTEPTHTTSSERMVKNMTQMQEYKLRPYPDCVIIVGLCKHGVCSVDITRPDMTVAFPNLGVQCVKRNVRKLPLIIA